MGQRAINHPRRKSQSRAEAGTPRPMQAAIFATPLGWIGVAGSDEKVAALTIGHSSAEQVRESLAAQARAAGANGEFEESDWHPDLRRALEKYAQGRFVDLREFQIDFGPTTPYRKRVLETARRIPYGTTMSYGELAAKAGKPRAARAVGSAMASNRIALLIPCHRVVASGGKIGGFSCHTGVELKQRLLAMEADSASKKAR